jgi:hypothetical protein
MLFDCSRCCKVTRGRWIFASGQSQRISHLLQLLQLPKSGSMGGLSRNCDSRRSNSVISGPNVDENNAVPAKIGLSLRSLPIRSTYSIIKVYWEYFRAHYQHFSGKIHNAPYSQIHSLSPKTSPSSTLSHSQNILSMIGEGLTRKCAQTSFTHSVLSSQVCRVISRQVL